MWTPPKYLPINKFLEYVLQKKTSINTQSQIDLTMTNNTYQMVVQHGELDESCNLTNHLSIAIHLIPLGKQDGPIPGLHSGLVILLVILLLILETLGNFLLICMIYYEKYGMDSKKRTITNMLLSRMIFVQILYNIFFMPLPTIGQIFGVWCKYFLSI